MNPVDLKASLRAFQQAALNFDSKNVQSAMDKSFAENAVLQMCHPFGTFEAPRAYFDRCLQPLHTAMPDLERRDMIVMAGTTAEGEDWVGTMGNYMGTFVAPFMDIPPTGHLAHMRYHEFYKITNNKIVEMQAIWDLPELMMQANAWPMTPQLGAYLCTPAPMTADGLNISGEGHQNYQRVIDMLTDLCRHPGDPDPKVMQMEKYWHPRFNWYGPAGIGSCRGISGFRNWHQIPFLNGMPDRKLDAKNERISDGEVNTTHWVAEGNYVCETGWPNMHLSLTHDGWLGIAPTGKSVFLRSLDFWRLEDGLIRENWVLVDLLDLYNQIGVDVIGRLREFNKARNIGPVHVPSGTDFER